MLNHPYICLVLYLKRRDLLRGGGNPGTECADSFDKILSKVWRLGDCHSMRSLNASHADFLAGNERTICV